MGDLHIPGDAGCALLPGRQATYAVMVVGISDSLFSCQLANSPETTVNLFNYYSFVTLTTLGYGDIVPLTPVTQAWVAVEATVGQFFLAIIIARLVSSYGNHEQRST